MRRFLLIIIGLLFVSGINAYDFETNGLYYSINSDNKTVSVVKGDVKYQGDIVIPSSVRNNNIDYVVTSVSGFNDCYNVKSLSISHTVSKIKAFDFMNCSGLASIVVDNNNPVYDSRNGCNAIIETANNKLILGCQNTIIPNTVKILGDRAFDGCTGLTEITIPNSVVSMEEYVFTKSHLTSITIPSNLTSIDLSAFYICNYLTNIVVEKGNPVYDARDNCNAIIETATNTLYIGCKNSTIPRTVETIGRFAFTQCYNLTSIDIPNNVKRIEDCAFQSCPLTSLYIPASVDSIEYGAFRNCNFVSIQVDKNNKKYDSRGSCNAIIGSTTNSLILGCKNTSIPQNVLSIGREAFCGCNGITSLTIPNSVTSIGSEAFCGCRNLTSVNIGENVTSIESYAFENCKALSSITFSNRLTYLGDRAFNKTAWLDNQASGLVYAGNWAYVYKGDMPANTSVVIKSGTLGIANSAFQNCTGLVSITFPNSLSTIGYWSFYGCSSLKDVISEIKTPFEIASSVFSVYSTAKLTVPKGTKSAYQSTNYWNKFSNIVESTSESNDDFGKVADVVDLGLSVKWASWNIGASKPEEYGSYFSWGETSPKNNYAWSTYKYGNPPSKYNSTDNKKTLDSSDDAAVVLWGGKWRMPTNEEEKELYERCKWTYTKRNGINGYQVSGPNGNSIFLPLAGLYDANSTLYSENSGGWYWSSTSLNNLYACGLYLLSSTVSYSISSHDKCDGHVIRPVYVESSQSQSIVVIAKNYTREYGNANPSFEYTVSGGSISGTPKITCSATKTSSVGTYTIKIEKGSVTNSNVTFVDGTLTITKAPLTITAKSYTRKQGESNPSFDVTYSGFKNNETSSVLTRKPTCSTTATSSSSPGIYDINVSGATATNYDITYVKGTLTVTQADAIVLTARSYTREYGDANPTFGYTKSGATLNGTPVITCSATKYSAVGTYPIKIAQGSVSNYNVTYVEGTLTITKAPLTITAKSYTRKQGEANPTFDVTYSGFKNGETASVLTQKPICSTTATPSSSPGTYDITVSGAFATNYDISYVNGKLTVTQADAVIVTARNYTREYGEDNPSFGYTTSGATLLGSPSITCSATRYSPVGTYPIRIAQGSISNYNVTYVDGTLTITKAPLSITAKSYTREEGQSNPTFEVTYSGFKNGETEFVLSRKPSVSTEATSSSPIGTYALVPYGAQADNYNMYYYNGTLTITEKSTESVYYDGITYLCTNATRTAEVQSVDNGLMNVEIPSSVSYKGKTYEVTSIANSAFSYRTFNYVALPSTITSITSMTFYSSMLGALIWNANSSLSSSVFNNMAMLTTSNFLLYVNSRSYAPSNVSNVVVGSTASSIVLKDGIDTRFYCPRAFTAQTISYTHHYGMTTGGNGKGWETIALPFDVQKIEHKTKGVLTPFAVYSDMMTQRPFWLYELGSNGFRKTDAIKANTPYIIAMPNDPKYDEEYILAGDVTFSATNATVLETGSLTKSSSKGMTFIPAFAVKDKASSVYALNVSNELVYNSSANAGSEFVSNLRSVYPFEAYMTTSSSAARSLSIVFDDGTTGVDEIPLREQKAGLMTVYTLTGMLMFSVPQGDFVEKWKSLPSGVYIVNGQKMIKTEDSPIVKGQ